MTFIQHCSDVSVVFKLKSPDWSLFSCVVPDSIILKNSGVATDILTNFHPLTNFTKTDGLLLIVGACCVYTDYVCCTLNQ